MEKKKKDRVSSSRNRFGYYYKKLEQLRTILRRPEFLPLEKMR